MKLKRKRRDEEERTFPTKEEVRPAIEKVSERHRAFIVTAIFTGMRISELRGLTRENVDFKKKVIHVCQRADPFNVMGKPKGRSSKRAIPMAPIVATELIAWQLRCPAGPLGLVFPNGVGKINNCSNIINRMFKPLLIEIVIVDAAGKPRFTFHGLRHAAASQFIEQGWTPKRIQSLLGHSQITMTMDVCGHLFASPEDDVMMFEKLQADLLTAYFKLLIWKDYDCRALTS